MFRLRYAVNELRRRGGRTVLTALGLAAGVGLVVGIVGVSQGLEESQRKVLAPLTSIGTDVLVTRVAGAEPSAAASPSPGPGAGFFGAGPGGPLAALNQQDAAALVNENRNVLTDLSQLGKPGEQFTRDFFLSGTYLSFPQEALEEVRKVKGVAAAVAGLTQLASHQTGTVPQIVAELQTGGQTVEQVVAPEPMTDQERAAFEQCVEQRRAAAPAPSPGAEPGRGPGGFGRRFEDCLPQRFREFRARFVVPLQTIRQVINPPSTNITSTSYVAAGIDPAHPEFGLVTARQLTKGRWIAPSAPNEVLAAVAYAGRNGLDVGSQLPINGQTFTVVGLVRPTLTGSTADLYFPLATLQALAGKPGRITQILVRAADAGAVGPVASRIRDLLPGAEVVTTASLAEQVTGSLADARRLAGRLGGALAAMVLAGAFAMAVLLTLSSVAKRVPEIGTLRAIGWSRRMVVSQILTETMGIGILGGVLGVVVGEAVSVAVGALSPPLTATSPGVSVGSRLAGLLGQAAAAAPQTVTVRLHAPVRPATLALGAGLALAGGLLAGAVGGWRAARLPPSRALADYDALPDVGVIAEGLEKSVQELLHVAARSAPAPARR